MLLSEHNQGGFTSVTVPSNGGTAYKDVTLPISSSNLVYGGFVSTGNPNTRFVSFTVDRLYVYSTTAGNIGVFWVQFGRA